MKVGYRIAGLAAAIAAVVVGGAFAYELYLRWDYTARNAADPDINKFVLYDKRLFRTPNQTIRFAFYSEAGILAEAAPKLNNLGYFSERDFVEGGEDGKFRIVVIGGEQTASSTVTKSWPDFLEDALGGGVRVYNVAWPDAGPAHYVKYWKEFGQAFRPDLVIVNFVETDFFRGRLGAQNYLRYLGMPVVTSQAFAEYKLPKGAARIIPAYAEGAKLGPERSFPGWDRPAAAVSLRDPYVIPSRPYGTFISTEAIGDAASLAALRSAVVGDMIAGAIAHYGCLACAAYEGTLKPVHQLRNFEVISVGKSATKEQLIEYGRANFGWIARNVPNVLLLHNFTPDTAPYDLSEALKREDPAFDYIDMRQWAPKADAAELRSWTLAPFMGEKWSQKGMQVYAEMVAKLLRARDLAR